MKYPKLHKKMSLTAAMALILTLSFTQVRAETISFDFNGVFTMLTSDGTRTIINTSMPYYDDPTWNYGVRTQISGTMSIDSITGAAAGTIGSFEFCEAGSLVVRDLTMQAIGNGFGGPGNLILGNLLFDWNGNYGVPVSMVWDASGFMGAGPYSIGQVISNVGAVPASNNTQFGSAPIGPAPMATTAWNTTTVAGTTFGTAVSGALPLIADTVGGSPMVTYPFINFNATFDITSITITGASPVPAPAAIWLFASGLFGLLGVARRKITV